MEQEFIEKNVTKPSNLHSTKTVEHEFVISARQRNLTEASYTTWWKKATLGKTFLILA